MAWLDRKHISTIYRCMNTERKHVHGRCVSCFIRDFKASVPKVKPHSVIWNQNWNQFILKPQRKLWRKLVDFFFFVLFSTCTFYFCGMCSIGREIRLTGCLRVSFSSDADRHADLSGSPLKSKSTRKPLACIIGYLGGYFFNRRRAWRTVSVSYHWLLKINIPILNVSLSSSWNWIPSYE